MPSWRRGGRAQDRMGPSPGQFTPFLLNPQHGRGGDGTGEAAPSQGALRALLSNPSNPRPLPSPNQLGETSTSKTLSQTALTSRSPRHAPGTREGGRACVVLTRAPENRGPEEFILRTASGGENNPKVKGSIIITAAVTDDQDQLWKAAT